MKVTVSQPRFLPHISYLHRIAKADIFVISDDNLFNKRVYEHRNKYYNHHTNKTGYLTLHIKKKSNCFISDLEIHHDDNINIIKETLRQAYKDCKYFDASILNKVMDIKKSSSSYLDYIHEHLTVLFEILDVNTQVVLASEYSQGLNGQERLENIVSNIKDPLYISGSFGVNYIKDFKYPIIYHSSSSIYDYAQSNGDIVPYMNILDMIFNTGLEYTKSVLSKDLPLLAQND